MDPRQFQFVEAVVEPDAARALAKASAAPELSWALFPRVLMAWLEVAGCGSYDGDLPGVPDVQLSLRKGEGGFTGAVTFGGASHAFGDASLYRVAALAAVALGVEPSRQPPLSGAALAKLGRSVDLLVKSRTLRKAAAGAAGGKPPGTAAQPQAPLAPVPPQPTQPRQESQVGTVTGTRAKPQRQVRLPGVRRPSPGVKRPTIKVNKSEAHLRCMVCGDQFMEGGVFTGCHCFRDLAKSVRTAPLADGYLLEFGAGWDAEAVAAVADALGK